MKYSLQGLVFEVSEINLTEKPAQKFYNITTEYALVKQNVTTNITINISYGLDRIMDLFKFNNNTSNITE